MSKPKWEETEELEDIPSFEDTLEIDKELEDVSMLESALRGGGQGLALGSLDELEAAGPAVLSDIKQALGLEDMESAPVKFDEFGRPIFNEKSPRVSENYLKDLERIRDEYKKAEESNPATYKTAEILSGAIPAVTSGGAALLSKGGQLATKEGLKQASKQLATKEGAISGLKGLAKASGVGAGYGAASAAGYSEKSLSEDPKGLLEEVGQGAKTGAGIGLAAPIVLKGAGKAVKGAKDLAGKSIEKFTPSLHTGFRFGKKHGLASSKKINNLIEDDTRELVKTIQNQFQKLGLEKKAAEQRAKEFAEKYDITPEIQQIADDFLEQSKSLLPKDADKKMKLVDEIREGLLRYDVQREKLVKKLEKEISDQLEKSENKEIRTNIDAEGKAVKDSFKSGDELESLQDIDRAYEDIAPLPFDTKGGRIIGQRAKMKGEYLDPETGQMVPYTYGKDYVKPNVPFDPSDITVEDLGSELFGYYRNKATGEMFSKTSPKSRFAETDFSNLELEELLELLPKYGKMAFEEGSSGDTQQLYKEMYKVLRNKINNLPDLPKNKREMVKLFETLDIMGITKQDLYNLKGPELVNLAKKMPGKMDVEKDYIQRRLISEDSPVSSKLEDLNLLTDAKKMLTRDGGGISETTRAGVLQKFLAGSGDVAGATYGKLTRTPSKVANKVSKATDDTLLRASEKLRTSNSEAMRQIGEQIQFAVERGGYIKDSVLYSISQNPAVRKIINDSSEDYEKSVGFRDPDSIKDTPAAANNSEPPTEDSFSSNLAYSQNQEDESLKELRKAQGEYDTQQSEKLTEAYEYLGEKFPELGKEGIAMIGGVESLHNKLLESPSGAKGLFQFIDKYGNTWEDEAESKGIDVPDHKFNLDRQKYVMEEALSDSKKQLQALGLPFNVQNAYVIHNMGYPEAKKFFAALINNPTAQTKDVLKSSTIKNNKSYYDGKTVEQAYSIMSQTLEDKGQYEFPQQEEAQQEEQIQELVTPQDLGTLQNALDRYKKYRGSGGEELYSAAGDRLMGEIDNLPVSGYEKDGLKDAVAEGDLQYLQQQLDEVKRYMS